MQGRQETVNYTYTTGYGDKPDKIQTENRFTGNVVPGQLIMCARELEQFVLAAEDDALARLEAASKNP